MLSSVKKGQNIFNRELCTSNFPYKKNTYFPILLKHIAIMDSWLHFTCVFMPPYPAACHSWPLQSNPIIFSKGFISTSIDARSENKKQINKYIQEKIHFKVLNGICCWKNGNFFLLHFSEVNFFYLLPDVLFSFWMWSMQIWYRLIAHMCKSKIAEKHLPPPSLEFPLMDALTNTYT